MTENAFRGIVQDNQDRVYNTCLGFLKNEEDAEDLAQEVFIKVYESYDNFLQKSELSTWIYRIAVNKCLEQIRKNNTQRRSTYLTSLDGNDKIADGFFHPGVALENKEMSAILFGAIEKLPESQQVAYTLNKVEGLSYDEVSKIMEKTVSSVESILHRAKSKLRELLKDYYESR